MPTKLAGSVDHAAFVIGSAGRVAIAERITGAARSSPHFAIGAALDVVATPVVALETVAEPLSPDPQAVTQASPVPRVSNTSR
ncbi:hypothetical protein [Nocardia sp. NPDC004604]|uniref:hypothetical protein n=1 Tax=Nocardia sp. NPDC004604 TaxID=3157013 RepID=UPI0033B3C122